MSQEIFQVPVAENEPVKSYAPGTPEKAELKKALDELMSKKVELPMIIDGKEVKSGKKVAIHPPHDLNHTLGYYYQGDESHVKMAIEAAL